MSSPPIPYPQDTISGVYILETAAQRDPASPFIGFPRESRKRITGAGLPIPKGGAEHCANVANLLLTQVTASTALNIAVLAAITVRFSISHSE
jgi:hypothetical protein